MKCIECNNDLVPVYEGAPASYADALHIEFHLGWGEFCDAAQGEDPHPQAFMCLVCASKLVAAFPNLGELISNRIPSQHSYI